MLTGCLRKPATWCEMKSQPTKYFLVGDSTGDINRVPVLLVPVMTFMTEYYLFLQDKLFIQL